MAKWLVPLEAWTEIEVEADTKEEAVRKAEEQILCDFDNISVTDNIITNLDDGCRYQLKEEK